MNPPVCEFHGYNVKERWSSKKGGRVCAFCVDGDPISVQSHPWARLTRVSWVSFRSQQAAYVSSDINHSLFLFVSKFAEEELETVQTGLRFHHQLMLLSPCATTVQELLDQPAFRPEHHNHMIMVLPPPPPLHHFQTLAMMASFVLYV